VNLEIVCEAFLVTYEVESDLHYSIFTTNLVELLQFN
jgi:hypothetical protein